MRAVDLIRKKREGGALSDAEIHFLVAGIGDEVADYQWSALLMAILWRGMRLSYTQVLRTPEFFERDRITQFGSINLTFRY